MADILLTEQLIKNKLILKLNNNPQNWCHSNLLGPSPFDPWRNVMHQGGVNHPMFGLKQLCGEHTLFHIV